MKFNIKMVVMAAVVLLGALALGCDVEPDAPEDYSRCETPPAGVVRLLNSGLTADGFNVKLLGTSMVRDNDDQRWAFIAAKIDAPGIDDTAVWATPSGVLDGTSLIVAAELTAQVFSKWQMPSGGTSKFAPKYDDEIEAAKACVERYF